MPPYRPSSAHVPQTDDDFTTYEDSVCSAIRNKEFYPSMKPDYISIPNEGIDLNGASKEISASKKCDGDLSVTTCAGAPCWGDPSAAGLLNTSCLCPMYEYTESELTFSLLESDIGHFDCEQYYSGSVCPNR